MPITVNGQEVPESLIQEEMNRVRSDPRWADAAESEKEQLLREAGEYAAISRVLIEWNADRDPRPIPTSQINAGLQSIRSTLNCGTGVDATALRAQVERGLKVQRVVSELTAGARRPREAEIENFYTANRENFRLPGTLHAAHIVRNVNAHQSEAQAFAAIEEAAAELARGEDFATVADRFSDCKGQGGDLGAFAEGTMVEEFERQLRELQPGQRSEIFTTPFGFHIAELHAKTTGGMAPFEAVRGDIEKVLLGMREHKAFQDGMELLRTQADIRRTPDAIVVPEPESDHGQDSPPLLHPE